LWFLSNFKGLAGDAQVEFGSYLFLDEDLNWYLGDFGSTRKKGALIWSYTKVLTPYAIPPKACAVPAMDFVLLCVKIAIELKKEEWKLLCGQHQNVQEHLIIEKLKLKSCLNQI
jgi:hypothetical protein